MSDDNVVDFPTPPATGHPTGSVEDFLAKRHAATSDAIRGDLLLIAEEVRDAARNGSTFHSDALVGRIIGSMHDHPGEWAQLIEHAASEIEGNNGPQ